MGNKIRSGIVEVKDIQVIVSWKRVKHATLRVCPPSGDVKMSVPIIFTLEMVRNLIDARIAWIKSSREKLLNRHSAEPKLNPDVMRRFYKEVFPKILKKWESAMELKSRKVTIRAMTSCWGSCRSNTKSLTFNVKLAYKPIECVDYVVIHELAHFIHPNHSPEFWALVEQYCPDYRRIRNRLNTEWIDTSIVSVDSNSIKTQTDNLINKT